MVIRAPVSSCCRSISGKSWAEISAISGLSLPTGGSNILGGLPAFYAVTSVPVAVQSTH
jgi:hypothetical protein